MANNSMERMKQLIEDKKNKGTKGNMPLQPEKSIGSSRKAFKTLKKGGALDK